MELSLRMANIDDISELLDIQKLFHVSTISEEDKKDGFVTTFLTEEQWKRLILDERGVHLILQDDGIMGYALAASWDYWSEWPIFKYMIEDLPNITYEGEVMTLENSFQYGPVCLKKEIRHTGAVKKIFDFAMDNMSKRYSYLLTFINKKNARSFKAHTEKVKLDVVKEFSFNDNQYYELATKIKR